MENNTLSILVVGSINMDLVLKTERIPGEGESLIGENYGFIPGGKGANQAVATARLGASVSFVGKIGSDPNGDKLKESIHSESISTEFLFVGQSSLTGLAVIMLESNGQNRILVYPGANMTLKIEDIRKAFTSHYDAVLVQFEIPKDIIIETCNLSKEMDIPILVDTGPAQEFPLEAIQNVDILSPNETEAFALTGIKVENEMHAADAAKILYERSRAAYIIIKMGAKGSLLYHNKQIEHFPAHIVDAVDTTAAGDAFMAGLAVEWTQSRNIRKAIRYATIAGAITTTKLGAQPSLPRRKDVEIFSKERNIKW